MKESGENLDQHKVAGARRRLGFVAMLWWIAAGAGTIGLVQGLPSTWVRMLFVGLSWVLAVFFSYAWWEVCKGRLGE